MTDNQTLLGIQEIIAIKNQFIFLTLKPPAAANADWTIRHAGRYYQYEFWWRLFQSSVQHCFSRIADFHLPLPHQFFIICFPKKPLEAFEMGFKSDLEQFKCINLAPKKPLEAFEMVFKSYLKQFKCITLASNSLRTFFFLIYIYVWCGIMRTLICQFVFYLKISISIICLIIICTSTVKKMRVEQFYQML